MDFGLFTTIFISRRRLLVIRREHFIDFVKAATTFFGEINRHSSSNMSHLSNPYQKEDSFGRGVTANQKATIRAFDKFYSW